jgi:hypothetical protein
MVRAWCGTHARDSYSNRGDRERDVVYPLRGMWIKPLHTSNRPFDCFCAANSPARRQEGFELTNGALLAWINHMANMGQPRLAQLGGP